jgi:hypothetical protein
VEELDGHRVVHVTAGARVGMKDERDWRGVVLARKVLALDAPDGAGENDLGHDVPKAETGTS